VDLRVLHLSSPPLSLSPAAPLSLASTSRTSITPPSQGPSSSPFLFCHRQFPSLPPISTHTHFRSHAYEQESSSNVSLPSDTHIFTHSHSENNTPRLLTPLLHSPLNSCLLLAPGRHKPTMNLFRLVADLMHLASILILLLKMQKTRSVAGNKSRPETTQEGLLSFPS